MAAAKMTAKKRRSLKASEFGLPKLGKYPIDTPARARNAKARAAQEFEKGNLSKKQLDKIVRRADAKLGGTKAEKKARAKVADIVEGAKARRGGKPPVLKPAKAREVAPAIKAKKKAAKKKAAKKKPAAARGRAKMKTRGAPKKSSRRSPARAKKR